MSDVSTTTNEARGEESHTLLLVFVFAIGMLVGGALGHHIGQHDGKMSLLREMHQRQNQPQNK